MFARNSGETPGIFRSDPAGGQPSLLLRRAKLPVIWLEASARDGRALVFRSGADRDAWQVSPATPTPQRLTQGIESIDQVQLSPDGRWIAYNSAESGRHVIYVSAVPYSGNRWPVSNEGGVQATWKADARELYYVGLDGALNAVDVRQDGDRIDLGLRGGCFEPVFPSSAPSSSSTGRPPTGSGFCSACH